MKKKNMSDNGSPVRKRNRKKPLRRLLKAVLWIAGSWLIILLALQVTLSTSVATGIVDRLSEKYVDGAVNFGNLKANMFSRFPNVSLVMDDFSVTYPADRFDELEKEGVQGELLYQGTGETADTLASFERLSVSLNLAALATGRISIPHMKLTRPRIFIHRYGKDRANWDMFNLAFTEEEQDTTGKSLIPKMVLGRISLAGKPHVVYTDSRDTLFAMIDIGKAAFNGRLRTRSASRNRIGLDLDNILVAGRMASDTLAFRLNGLSIHERDGIMDVAAAANATLLTKSYGRMNIPVGIEGTLDVRNDSIPVVEISGMKAHIADIPVSVNARLGFGDDKTYIEALAEISQWNMDAALEEYAERFVPEFRKIDTDATVSLIAACFGTYDHRTGRLPSISAAVSIPESYVKHSDVDADLTMAIDLNIANDEEGRITVDVPKAELKTDGFFLSASGNTPDIADSDPLINLQAMMSASLDSLSRLLPDSLGLTAKGNLSADIRGGARLSQLNIYSFSYSSLYGEAIGDHLVLKSPSDTLDAYIQGLNISIGPEDIKSKSDSTQTRRMLAIKAGIDSTDISYKRSMNLKGRDIAFSAKNSAEAFNRSDSTRLGHFGGSLTAKEISFRDAVSATVRLSNTTNRFQMVPKRENPEVPTVTIVSENKRISLNAGKNRVSLTDSRIRASAEMNTIERRKRREARLDSLALVYPDTPRDSLMSRMRAERNSSRTSAWAEDDDFRKYDIDIRLDEAIAGYFRNWDLDGKIDVQTGIVMTPYFPLRNRINGFSASFNNDMIRLDSLKVNSGKSELAGTGSVKGLRRALAGRSINSSTLDMDIDLKSSKMDADELLDAWNRGMGFNPDSMDAGLEDMSDSEFLEKVTADTTSASGSSALMVIPSNINATIRLDARDISYSGLAISQVTSRIVARNRCLQITGTRAKTNVGDISFEGFYATRSKSDINAGFDFNFKNITADKVIGLMPAIDTMVPMLKSFKGMLDCQVAATARLDTAMNILTPSINGVMRIGGKDMSISDNETFRSIAKTLKFKNLNEGRINSMTVEGMIQDNKLEVFPFVIEMDRYIMALSGVQNLDLSFRYHVSMIKSPMLFRFGVDLYGNDFEDIKFKIGKAKYKSANVPVFSAEIDKTRINLSESIRNIFIKGIDRTIAENRRQDAIAEHKKAIGYVEAVDMEMEELSEVQKTVIQGE